MVHFDEGAVALSMLCEPVSPDLPACGSTMGSSGRRQLGARLAESTQLHTRTLGLLARYRDGVVGRRSFVSRSASSLIVARLPCGTSLSLWITSSHSPLRIERPPGTGMSWHAIVL